jgi:hypothetical protein
MLGGLITIAGGIIASSGFIVKRRPDAQQLIDKLLPYQGWIGVVMFFWGIWESISVVTHLGLLATMPLRWIFWALSGTADLLVGFLLGFGLIVKYAFKAEPQPVAVGAGGATSSGGASNAALERATKVRARLVAIQAPLGLLAIVMGVLYTVWIVIL